MIIKRGCSVLRAIEDRDFEILYKMINSPEIEKATAGWHFPVSTSAQKKWMESDDHSDNCLRLMIELDNGETIGMISLSKIDLKNGVAEINYKIYADKDKRKKNDAEDAINAILSYGFDELRLNCIYSVILEDNYFALKMAKKMHFTQEGILRQRIYKNGVVKNQICFSIIRDEYNLHNMK